MVIPISAVLSGAMDFLLSFLVLIGIIFYYHLGLAVNILWLPLFLLLAFVTALGAGLWFSALNVEFRDVHFTIPFLVQIWLFATPIAYPSSLISGSWKVIYGLNPMATVIEGFRWALLGSRPVDGDMAAASTLIAIALLISGFIYFRRMEKNFADVV